MDGSLLDRVHVRQKSGGTIPAVMADGRASVRIPTEQQVDEAAIERMRRLKNEVP